MKKLAKKIAREYLPYKYMLNRRVSQHIEILKEQEEPPVYNEKGERKRVFFLRDAMCRNTPYSLVYGQYPDKILWDRNNVGLPIQFYSHEYIWTENNKYAKKKYAFLFESEAIKNDEYARALLDTERMKEYNKIFTFSEYNIRQYPLFRSQYKYGYISCALRL